MNVTQTMNLSDFQGDTSPNIYTNPQTIYPMLHIPTYDRFYLCHSPLPRIMTQGEKDKLLDDLKSQSPPEWEASGAMLPDVDWTAESFWPDFEEAPSEPEPPPRLSRADRRRLRRAMDVADDGFVYPSQASSRAKAQRRRALSRRQARNSHRANMSALERARRTRQSEFEALTNTRAALLDAISESPGGVCQQRTGRLDPSLDFVPEYLRYRAAKTEVMEPSLVVPRHVDVRDSQANKKKKKFSEGTKRERRFRDARSKKNRGGGSGKKYSSSTDGDGPPKPAKRRFYECVSAAQLQYHSCQRQHCHEGLTGPARRVAEAKKKAEDAKNGGPSAEEKGGVRGKPGLGGGKGVHYHTCVKWFSGEPCDEHIHYHSESDLKSLEGKSAGALLCDEGCGAKCNHRPERPSHASDGEVDETPDGAAAENRPVRRPVRDMNNFVPHFGRIVLAGEPEAKREPAAAPGGAEEKQGAVDVKQEAALQDAKCKPVPPMPTFPVNEDGKMEVDVEYVATAADIPGWPVEDGVPVPQEELEHRLLIKRAREKERLIEEARAKHWESGQPADTFDEDDVVLPEYPIPISDVYAAGHFSVPAQMTIPLSWLRFAIVTKAFPYLFLFFTFDLIFYTQFCVCMTWAFQAAVVPALEWMGAFIFAGFISLENLVVGAVVAPASVLLYYLWFETTCRLEVRLQPCDIERPFDERYDTSFQDDKRPIESSHGPRRYDMEIGWMLRTETYRLEWHRLGLVIHVGTYELEPLLVSCAAINHFGASITSLKTKAEVSKSVRRAIPKCPKINWNASYMVRNAIMENTCVYLDHVKAARDEIATPELDVTIFRESIFGRPAWSRSRYGIGVVIFCCFSWVVFGAYLAHSLSFMILHILESILVMLTLPITASQVGFWWLRDLVAGAVSVVASPVGSVVGTVGGWLAVPAYLGWGSLRDAPAVGLFVPPAVTMYDGVPFYHDVSDNRVNYITWSSDEEAQRRCRGENQQQVLRWALTDARTRYLGGLSAVPVSVYDGFYKFCDGGGELTRRLAATDWVRSAIHAAAPPAKTAQKARAGQDEVDPWWNPGGIGMRTSPAALTRHHEMPEDGVYGVFGYRVDDAVFRNVTMNDIGRSPWNDKALKVEKVQAVPTADRRVMATFSPFAVSGVAMPVSDRGHAITTLAGLAHRGAGSTPKPNPKHMAVKRRIVDEICEAHFPPLNDSDLLPFEQLLSGLSYNQTRIDTIRQMHEDRPGDFYQPEDRHKHGVSAHRPTGYFNKEEPYGSFKFPRGIHAMGAELLKADVWGNMGRFIYAVQEVVYSIPPQIKHLTPQGVAERLMALGPGSKTVSDYSSYEASFTRDVQESAQFRLYDHMASGLSQGSALMEHIRWALGKTHRAKNKFFTVTLKNLKCSGDFDTALSNWFDNVATWAAVLDIRHGIHWSDSINWFLCEGDDNITDDHGLEVNASDFANLGMKAKVESHLDPGEAGFCQKYVTEAGTLVGDVILFLGKRNYLPTKYHNASRACKMSLARVTAMSILSALPNAPGISEWAWKVLELTDGVVVRASHLYEASIRYGQNVWKNYEAGHRLRGAGLAERLIAPVTFSKPQIMYEDRVAVSEVFGFSLEQQLDLTIALDRWVGGRLFLPLSWFPAAWVDFYDSYNTIDGQYDEGPTVTLATCSLEEFFGNKTMEQLAEGGLGL